PICDDAVSLELAARSLQGLAVLLSSSRVRQVETALPLRRPGRGHVEQEDGGPRKARLLLHARRQSGVRVTVVERNEDLLEHAVRNSELEIGSWGPESKIQNDLHPTLQDQYHPVSVQAQDDPRRRPRQGL